MSGFAIPPMTGATAPPEGRNPQKVRDAAQQFESLLIGQILHSARSGGSGWLGSEDSSADCATDFAEQQFATMMSQAGGLGLGDLISRGLVASSSSPAKALAKPSPLPVR